MPEEPDKSSSSLTRRKFMQGLAAAGLTTSIAGCSSPSLFNTGPQGRSEYTVKKLDERYTLEGEAKALVPQSLFRQNYELKNGQQCRLAVKGGVFGEKLPAVFTLRQNHPIEVEAGTIYLSQENLDRIGAIPGDTLIFNGYAPSNDVSSQEAARQTEEFVEQGILSQQQRQRVISLAPHGGDIEKQTAQQALRVSNFTGSDVWLCLGYDDAEGRAKERWHIPSEQIHPAAFNKLGDVVGKYLFSVSFHGAHDTNSVNGVAIGGLAAPKYKRTIRDEIRKSLQNEGVDNVNVTVYQTGAHKGTDPQNLANRVTNSGRDGVIIKQSENVRNNHWAKVADGVRTALESIQEEKSAY